MRKLLLSLFLFLPFAFLRAQNTAPDVTLFDCNGVQHSLYAELDQGRIIMLQIIDPKATATLNSLRNLESLASTYKSAYADKVYLYIFLVDVVFGCDEMLVIFVSVIFNYFQFENSRAIIDYFRITSLPAIIVLGNNSHRVYGTYQSYAPARDAAVKASIEEAIAESSETGTVIKNSLGTVFPNPFTTSLNVRLNPATAATRVSVCDLTGKSLLTKEFNSEKLINFNTSSLQKGIYFLNFYQGDKITGTLKLVKKQ